MASDDAPRAAFNVDLGRAWCSFHARPWKATWPEGGGIRSLRAMVPIVVAVLERDEVLERAAGDVGNAGPVLASLGPLCCYLARHDPDALAAAYAAADVDPPRLHG